MNTQQILTVAHVVISLLGIAAGFVAMAGMLSGNPANRSTGFFLLTTILTSVTGFAFFPLSPFKPGHAVAILSLILLAAAVYALYIRKLTGPWRAVYLATAIASQYFNVFVLIIQSFQKIPVLKALAPTQSELPFAAAQLVTLVAFLALGVMAVKRTQPRLAV